MQSGWARRKNVKGMKANGKAFKSMNWSADEWKDIWGFVSRRAERKVEAGGLRIEYMKLNVRKVYRTDNIKVWSVTTVLSSRGRGRDRSSVSSDINLGRGGRGHLITSGWRWKSRLPMWSPLARGLRLVSVLWGHCSLLPAQPFRTPPPWQEECGLETLLRAQWG